jgi:uncharacterized membrane protein
MELVDERTFAEKVSDYVANFGGSWWFIFSALGVILFWVVLNTLTFLDVVAWDKYPFILLNLFLSLIAAFQAPFILMSQKRVEKKQDEAYKKLFAELKELLESDLELEKEIMENHKIVANDIISLKEEIQRLRKRLKRRKKRE